MYDNPTYLTHQVVCEDPKIVRSPLCQELVCRYGVGALHGRPFNYTKEQRKMLLHKFPYRAFSARDIAIDDARNSYVIDQSTGETYPLYIEVSCGHCPVCKARKTNGLVQRCCLETLSYDSFPWFITLTYANKFLPVHGVDKDDVQRYFKRLRINLERQGIKNKVRYLCSAEYGDNGTRRPHYHIILWGLPIVTMSLGRAISDCIDRSWNMGNVVSRVMDASDDSCLYYTCKYVFKDKIPPAGKRPPFCLRSNGHGGIGSRWIDLHADEMRKTLNTSFKYLNRFSGKISELVFDSYILNRVFPSFCRYVDIKLRNAYIEFGRVYNSALTQDQLGAFRDYFDNKWKEYTHKFTDLYQPYKTINDVPLTLQNHSEPVAVLSGLSAIIDKYSISMYRAHFLNDLRQTFIYKLFRYAKEVNISERSYRARKRYNQSLAREVL